MDFKIILFLNILVAILSSTRCENMSMSADGDHLTAQGYNFGQYKKEEYGYQIIEGLNAFVNTTTAYANLVFSRQNSAEFRLFTRSNPETYTTVNTRNLLPSNFNKSLETVIIVHGWLQHGSTPNILNMKDAILSNYNMNIFVVHWGKLASTFYDVARFGIYDIAKVVAEMITFLNTGGQPMNNIHLVGFSLGAHVAGIAGKRVGGKLGSIIGLDPAFPLFTIWKTTDRLNVGDAQYVQVVHTTGGALGFMMPLGDFDVYLNGGQRQPGCVEIIPMCSHAMSQIVFSNALRNPSRYKANECKSFWQIALGYCTTTGISSPLIQLKPVIKYYGVYWATT